MGAEIKTWSSVFPSGNLSCLSETDINVFTGWGSKNYEEKRESHRETTYLIHH